MRDSHSQDLEDFELPWKSKVNIIVWKEEVKNIRDRKTEILPRLIRNHGGNLEHVRWTWNAQLGGMR